MVDPPTKSRAELQFRGTKGAE
jgi:hypothetical protein